LTSEEEKATANCDTLESAIAVATDRTIMLLNFIFSQKLKWNKK
jgi:hypothetical protein